MGGSSGGSSSQVVDQGGLIDSPLNNFLIPQAQNMLTTAGRWSTLGSPFNFLPNIPLGQTYVPGPNQTIFGNPYNTQQMASNYFGQSAVPNQQQMYRNFLNPQGQGGGSGGGVGQGGGGGGQQQGITDPILGQVVGKLQGMQQQQPQGQQPQGQQQQTQAPPTPQPQAPTPQQQPPQNIKGV